MTTQTTTINDNLVNIDNVLIALNYLLEEVKTRKDELTNFDNINDIVIKQVNDPDFIYNLSHRIFNSNSDSISGEIAHKVMVKIDDDIEAFINDRVNKALYAAGVKV